MTKGKNGKQIGAEYLQRVESWKASVESSGTVHEYAYAGRVKRIEVARECGFSRSVCVQNEGVKAILERCDREWYGTEPADQAASRAAVERAELRVQMASSDNSRFMARIAELEAENRALRKQLARYEALEAVIQDGMLGFGVNS
jgi:hypothetical protein